MRSLISKQFVTIFFLLILLLQCSTLLFSHRYLITTAYDTSYWKDFFIHSPWNLPLSTRLFPDTMVIPYASSQLLEGVFLYTPKLLSSPTGLYTIMFSLIFFHNPFFQSVCFFFGILIALFFLCRVFFRNTQKALLVTTLFSLDPFVFSLIRSSSVELIQTCFFLLHALLLIRYATTKPKNHLLLICSAVFFTFCLTTTPSVLTLLVLGVALWYCYTKIVMTHRKPFLVTICLCLLLLYIPLLFLTHVSPLYKESFFLSLFTNSTHPSWSLLTLMVFGLGIYKAVQLIKTHSTPRFSLWGQLVFVAAIMFTAIFSPSSLLLILPFCYILTFVLLQKWFHTVKGMSILMGIALLSFLLLPLFQSSSPQSTFSSFAYNFRHQFFHDIYMQNITRDSMKGMTRDQFRFITQTALSQAHVTAMTFSPMESIHMDSFTTAHMQMLVHYHTQDLGSFSETKTILFQKEGNEWKIDWHWDTLLNDFKPGDTLITTILPGKRGRILTKNQTVLAEDTRGILILINPEKVDRKKEDSMLRFLQTVTKQSPLLLQQAYRENVLPNTYTPVATTFRLLTSLEQLKLATYPGITLLPTIIRNYPHFSLLDPRSITNTAFTECCTRIYSSTTYHGASGAEKTYEKTLRGNNGGQLLLVAKDKRTKRTLLRSTASEGHDIILAE